VPVLVIFSQPFYGWWNNNNNNFCYLFSYLFSQPPPDEDNIFRIADNEMPVRVFQQMAQRVLVNVNVDARDCIETLFYWIIICNC
jgi:hypothetical protein